MRAVGIVSFLIFSCLTISIKWVSAQEHPQQNLPSTIQYPIKISITRNTPPFSMELPNGKPTGFYVELWQLWSKTNEIPIEFIPEDLMNSQDLVQNGKADFQAGLFLSEQRLKWADFSIPIHRVKTGIYFNGDQSNIKTLSELTGEKVGVVRGSYQEAYLQNSASGITLIPHQSTREALESLLNNKVKAIVAETPILDAELGRRGLRGALQLSNQILLTNDVRALFLKGNQQLSDLIDSGLQNIPLSELIALEKKWLPGRDHFYNHRAQNSVKSLNREQQKWLSENSQLVLGVDSVWPPFEFIGESGEYAGIGADYVELIREKLNVTMQPLMGLSWGEVIEKTKAGEIDLLPVVTITEKRKSFLAFTDPYLSFPLVIATRKDAFFVQQLEELENFKVGVAVSSPGKEILETNYPQLSLRVVENVYDGLKLLNDGEIDAFVQNLAVITHEINRNNFSEIKIAAETPYKLELAMGVRKEMEQLVPILNQVLSTIDYKQRAAITNNWLALQVNLGFEIATFLRWATPVLILLMTIILFIVRSNRKLKMEVIERKRAEHSLAEAKEQAEQANRTKDDFLANMSHEIRTPMNAVVGMSYLLEHSGLNNEQLQYIEALNSSASSLLVLIDDILDLSKIEAGKLEIESILFELDNLVNNIAEQIQLKLDDNKTKFITDICPCIPNLLKGDPLRLGQVLLNLTSNSVKFTTHGEIKLSAKIIERDSEQITVGFTVSDTGIGMTEQQQARIFNTYSQADTSTTRKYGGTGLGLSISKNLCELMGGEISVDANEGKGSNFHFTARFGYQTNDKDFKSKKIQNLSSSPTSSYPALQGIKVLIVDDNQVNLMIASKILAKHGVEYVTAKDGKLALKALEESHFDAVLMDIQMPEMDGFTATRHIRSQQKFKDLPVIAMTANVMSKDIKKSIEAGMNCHIGKPLKIDLLLQVLEDLVRKNS